MRAGERGERDGRGASGGTGRVPGPAAPSGPAAPGAAAASSPRFQAAALATVLALAPAAAAGDAAVADPPPDAPGVTRAVPPVVARDVVPAELPDDPSSFTTVIDVDDFRGEVTSVEELLDRTPGVQVRRFGGEGQPAEISIRGSTAAQVVVTLDGIRLNSAQSGAVDLSTLPLGILDRIEVSRGGGSVQAGSDAIGGVVNLVTRRPGGPRRIDASVGGGSFGTWRGNLASSGSARGVEYAFAYDGFTTDGDFEFRRPVLDLGGGVVIEPDPETATRINNEAVEHAGLATLGRSFGEHVHLTLRDQVYFGSRGQPGLDAGSVGTAGQRANAHERLTRNLISATLEGAELSPLGLDGALEIWHRYQRTRFRDPDVVPGFGAPIDSLDRNDEGGSRLRVEREATWLAVRQRGSLSLEARRDLLDSNELDDQERNSFGVVLQDDVGAFEDALRVIPALRVDHTQGFDTEWLPRVGAIVSPLPWLHVKGNFERAYRAPNFDELYFPDRGFLRGNPALAPEEATSWDVGIELAAARLGPVTDAFLEGARFANDVDDSIVFLLVSPSLVEPRNTGPATIRGFELAGGFRLFGWVGVSASYTHLDASIDATGAPLPGRADDETSVRVEVGPPSRAVRLVGTMQRTSEIPVSDSGGTVLPDRTVFDAALLVDLARVAWLPVRVPAESLLVTLEGANLTDRAVRDALFFPQPGRTLNFRVEGRW